VRMDFKNIKIPFKIQSSVLALGSQSKNTICFVKGNTASISKAHADLNNPQEFLRFEKDIQYCLKKKPKIIAHDLHPEYQSTKYALGLLASSFQLLSVQHHHAHVAGCMVENNLKNQKVIGVVFDGTGLGLDNNIWGAEFLICDYKSFTRKAHLKEIPLLGGEKAIQEPSRLTLAWLYCIYGYKFLNLEVDFTNRLDKKKWLVLKQMLFSGVNSPLASSMGRLFDAAASLILAKPKAAFEAELGMELEKLAVSCQTLPSSYKFKIIKRQNNLLLDPALIFKGIIKDLKSGEQKARIAYKFHVTVAQMINRTCCILRQNTGIKRIVLSGGVFQNKLLLKLSSDLLYKYNFKVYTHKKLTCNDAGISLGQAVVAGLS
jgi:hydrogenase maturation protein HypF